MKTTLLLVLLLITSAAWAEWAQVGETDHAVLYIKPASIRKHGNLVTVSQLTDYQNRRLTDYKDQQNTGGMSLQTTIEYDCQLGKYRFLSIRRHTEPMGVGATLLETDNGPWHNMTPDTASETLFLILCNP